MRGRGRLAALAAALFQASPINSWRAAAMGQRGPCRLRLVLQGGDNMLGRAVQLTFPHQSAGEGLITDSMPAQHYLQLALRRTSQEELRRIREENADASYLWGDLQALRPGRAPGGGEAGPDVVRMLNLETAVTETTSNSDVPSWKGINYHLHSGNLPAILSALAAPGERLVVVLANNHAMDFGRRAFQEETLPLCSLLELREPGVQFAGAGASLREAQRARTTKFPRTRTALRTVAVAAACSGTPAEWAADDRRSGVLFVPAVASGEAVEEALQTIRRAFEADRRRGDEHPGEGYLEVRVVSIHWGPNWAYRSPGEEAQQGFRSQLARRLVDELGVDVVYGHSSHHIRGLEHYKGKLIVYGAGDFVNDYEGFENPGEEKYCRLGALFEVSLDARGDLLELRLVPTYMDRLRLRRLGRNSTVWSASAGQLLPRPEGSEELAQFVNRLSRKDCGPEGTAVRLRVVDGGGAGPELVYP